MKKLVTLLLVLAMVFNMTIMASATEAHTAPFVEEAKVHSHTLDAIGTDKHGYTTFETFADLKELVSKTYDNREIAHYVGSAEEFVITENIEIPEYLDLVIGSALVKIAEGVTVTVQGNLSVNKVTVNGTLVLARGGLYAKNALTVNGQVKVSGYININSTTVLVGLDKIKKETEYAVIYLSTNASTEAEVYERLAKAANDKNGFTHSINIHSDVTLNSDFTIPANAELMSGNKLTINGTCTIKGTLYSYENPIVVNGKLINNGYVYLDDTTLTISSGASYSGNGRIHCYGIKPEEALVGLNLDDFQIENWGYGYELTYVAGKTKLGSATDLTWGVEHRWDWDPETGDLIDNPAYYVALPGVASFKRATLDQAHYELALYKVGQEEAITYHGWEMGAGDNNARWFDVHFISAIDESGDYYFTVTAKGDGIEYADGPAVKSPVWSYVKPAKALSAPTQLTWNWPSATFNIGDDTSNVWGAQIQVYRTDNLAKEPRQEFWMENYYAEGKVDFGDWVAKEFGTGYYSFKVRLLSKDLNAVANGEWSEMSPTYYLEKDTSYVEEIITELDKIDTSTATTEEIREAVQEIDTETLKEAMQDDKANSGIMESIAALEEAVGGPAAVEVSEAAAAFDVSQVSIVGANLNNAESESAPITLVLDKPEEEHVLDTLYNSAVAVSFSMDLENVKDTENLDVPVKITLPIPETINPNFLVILHYHANGTVEEVHPYTFKSGGQWYAEIVLTSFSDFVMTETVEEDAECTHNWKDATCTEPKTCTICGDTDGSALGHDWNAATCTAPKTCKTCGATDGDKLPHTFDQEKVDPKYLVSEGVYCKSCKCGEKGTETFTVKAEEPEDKPEDKPEEKPEDKPVVNFKDVPSNAFYYDPVLWAVENGVTTGTSATTFSPDEVCTRGQVVTFLWRAAGQPEPKNTTNPFTDVKEGDFFYKAVLWAVENKVTTGTGDGTTFAPYENCNRGQIVTFLSRAKGGKATTSTNPFKDVAAGAFYYNPVLWAVENGITTGTGNGTFSPDTACNRGQVITFLYRAYK